MKDNISSNFDNPYCWLS